MNSNAFPSFVGRLAAVSAAVAGTYPACAQPGIQPAAYDTRGGVAARVARYTPPLSFVRFTDPAESAFSADVPQGWRVSGGVNRQSPIETRPALSAVSPDGILVTYGSATTPTFIVPNYILNGTGFPEGSRYPNGYGGFMVVRRYVPGHAFAEEYAHMVASAAGCSRPSILDRRERPDLAYSANAVMSGLASVGANVRVHYGEVAFESVCGGTVYRGQYIAGTLYSQGSNGLSIWALYALQGFFAPDGRGGMAQAALRRLLSSHRFNPRWVAMQGSVTKAASAASARSNDETSKTITQGYWNRVKRQDEIARRNANARRGTTDLSDPNTGETWNVWGNHNYWWRKPGSDEVFGTDSPDHPGVGWYQIQQY